MTSPSVDFVWVGITLRLMENSQFRISVLMTQQVAAFTRLQRKEPRKIENMYVSKILREFRPIDCPN